MDNTQDVAKKIFDPLGTLFGRWVFVVIAVLSLVFAVKTMFDENFFGTAPVITVLNSTSGFAIAGRQVYVQDKLMKGVDFDSFKVLDDYYEKDNHSVYDTSGDIISQADARSFVAIGNGFAKDANHVFAYSVGDSSAPTVISSKPSTFVVLNDSYEKDSDNIYYSGTVIAGADPKTFAFVANDTDKNYSKDKNSVYFEGQVIANADSVTFVYVGTDGGGNYDSYDKNHKYSYGQVYIPGTSTSLSNSQRGSQY